MRTDQYIKTGAYHAARLEECQDKIFFTHNSRFAAAAAADGATACRYSGKGAEIACRAVGDFLERESKNIFDFSDEKLSYLLVEHILYFLETETGKTGRELQKYASTMAAAYVEQKTGRTIAINLGDGAAFFTRGNEFQLCLPPRKFQENPCLTTTEDAYKAVEIKRLNLDFGDTLLLCTDEFLRVLETDLRQGGAMRDRIAAREFNQVGQILDAAAGKDDCSYIALTRTRK